MVADQIFGIRELDGHGWDDLGSSVPPVCLFHGQGFPRASILLLYPHLLWHLDPPGAHPNGRVGDPRDQLRIGLHAKISNVSAMVKRMICQLSEW